MGLEQCVLEYEGFSATRGRCHVILDRDASHVLVGDPRDNPGTSVTNAIEQVAFDLTRALALDVSEGLYEYVPWDVRRRREWIAAVEFAGDAWSLPVWTDADRSIPFVAAAFEAVRRIQPYSLTNMADLQVLNRVFRLRIEASPMLDDVIAALGTVQHVSQRRFFYVDVAADSQEHAVRRAQEVLAAHVRPERIAATTPGAPLDQPL